jgi:hypothetical protein
MCPYTLKVIVIEENKLRLVAGGVAARRRPTEIGADRPGQRHAAQLGPN